MYLIRAIAEEAIDWIQFSLGLVPGKIGSSLRYYFWLCASSGRINIKSAPFLQINNSSNIRISSLRVGFNTLLSARNQGFITIGKSVAFNRGVVVIADRGGSVHIGDRSIVGPGTVIRASNHAHIKKGDLHRPSKHRPGQIIIENDVWIGANVTILPGATIRTGTTIGAGAVVNKEIPAFSVAVGVPAAPISSS